MGRIRKRRLIAKKTPPTPSQRHRFGKTIITNQQISRMKQSKKYYHRSKHGKRMLATILQRTGKWIKIAYDCKDEKYIRDFDIGNPLELQRFTEYDGRIQRPKTTKYPFSVGQRVRIKKHGSRKWIDAQINRFSKHSHQALCLISNQNESGIGKYWVNIYDPEEIKEEIKIKRLSIDSIARSDAPSPPPSTGRSARTARSRRRARRRGRRCPSCRMAVGSRGWDGRRRRPPHNPNCTNIIMFSRVVLVQSK